MRMRGLYVDALFVAQLHRTMPATRFYPCHRVINAFNSPRSRALSNYIVLVRVFVYTYTVQFK